MTAPNDPQDDLRDETSAPYLRAAFDALGATWSDVLPFGSSGALEDDLESVSDNRFMQLLEKTGQLKRELDGFLATAAYEVERRSAVTRGANALAKRQGFSSTQDLLEITLGVAPGEARSLKKVGAATVGDRMITGVRSAPEAPAVAESLRAGSLNRAAAHEIVKFRDRVVRRIDTDRIDEGEEQLVENAPDLTLRGLKIAISLVEAHIDPDGLEPRIDEQRRSRSLFMRFEADGCLKISGLLDPVTGAYVKTAIDGYVTRTLRASRGNNVRNAEAFATADRRDTVDQGTASHTDDGHEGDTGTGHARDTDTENENENENESIGGVRALRSANVQFVETGTLPQPGEYELEDRSIPQLQADALAAFCEHIMGCDLSKLTSGALTVVVRMPFDAITPPRTSNIYDDDGTATNRSDSDNDNDNDNDNPGSTGSSSGINANSTGAIHNAPRLRTHNEHLEANARKNAEIDGIGPIDGHTARVLASKAGIIPIVLGSDSMPLDVGRRERHFSYSQKVALAERDGGCASCGRPPGLTEAHHVMWWMHGGKTSIDNGILLCTTCHHRMHEGWEIRIVQGDHTTSATVWFIPPGSVDIDRRPRLGGRKKFDPVYRAKYPPVLPVEPLQRAA